MVRLGDGRGAARAEHQQRDQGEREAGGGRDQDAPPASGRQRPLGEVLGQLAEHQQEDQQGHRLDQHLRERQVGRTVEQEEQCGPVAGHAQQHDGAEPSARSGDQHGGHHEQPPDHELEGVVGQPYRWPGTDPAEADEDEQRDHREDGGDVMGQRAALGAVGDLDREPVEAGHRLGVEVCGGRHGRERLLQGGDPAPLPEQDGAAGDRQQRGEQRGAEAGQEREAVAVLAGGHRERVGGERLRQRSPGETPGQARQPQQDGRGHEARCGGVPDRGGRHLRLGREGAPPEPQRVGDGDRRAEHDHGHQRPGRQRRDAGAVAAEREVGEALQTGLLGNEAERRRQPGHRRRRQRRDTGEYRQPAAQAAEPAELAGAGGVVHDPHDEEEGRLEQGVGEQHGQPAEGGRLGAGADEQHQQAELADRPVGEQQLEVVLPQCPPAAEEQGERTQQPHRRPPQRQRGQRRGQHRHQVDAGLHHRRRVQVGRDRGRRRHRAGQPEVERHQRRLAQRPGQHEQGGDHGGRPLRRGGEQRGQAEAARLVPQHQQPDQHRQPAGGGDDQRREGCRAVRAAGRIVGDEQVGEHRGGLPEHVHDNEVVGGDQPDHRRAERGQQAHHPGLRGVGLEVPAAVQEHQRADAGDHQRQQPLHQPDPERQFDTQPGDPRHGLGDHPAREHLWAQGEQPAEAERRQRRREPEGPVPQPPGEQGRQHGEQQVDADQGHQHRPHTLPASA